MKPFAKRPNTKSWALFKSVIDLFITDNVRKLATELGDWTTNHSACRRWNAYKDENNLIYEHVYHPLEEREKWRIYQHSRGTLKYKDETTTDIDYWKLIPIQINICAIGKKNVVTLLLE